MFNFLPFLSGGIQSLGGLAQLFGLGYNAPTKKASEMIGKIPGQVQGYYSPYMNAGQGALSDLQNQYKNLLGGDVQGKLGESYKESPGYQFALKQALQASGNAAAAGGQLGTPAHEQANMEAAQGIAAKDYQDYIRNQMGLYGMGLQGEQGINQMGFDASKGMADTTANAAAQQAQLAYASGAGKNAWNQNAMNNIFGGAGNMYSNYQNQQYMDFMKNLMGQASRGGTV